MKTARPAAEKAVRTGVMEMAGAVLLAVGWAAAAGAGQPEFAVMLQRTFATLGPYGSSPGPLLRTSEYPDLGLEGIWAYDPGDGSHRRLAPLTWGHAFGADFGPMWSSDGAALFAAEDHLVLEAIPAYLELDAVTLRLERRYAPVDVARWPTWTVQGPVVPDALAEATETVAGVVGFPVCTASVTSAGGFVSCEPVLFPDAPFAVTGEATDQAPLAVWRGPRPDDGGVRSLTSLCGLQTSTWDAGGLWTLDPQAKGVWLALREEGAARFMALTGTGLGGPLTFTFGGLPDFGGKPAYASLLFWHPARKEFLLRAGEVGGYGFGHEGLFALDEYLEVVRTVAEHLAADPVTEKPLPDRLAALPGTLPETYEQAIPIVAHAPGKENTFWTSDLWLYNPSETATTVTVRRVAAPESEKTVDLAPHASLHIVDALAWAGGGPEGDGVTHDALVLTSPYRWGAQVVAVSRSRTPAPEVDLAAAGGTLGHAVTAVPTRLGYSNHLPVEVSQEGLTSVSSDSRLLLDLREAGRFRHNVGVVNDSSEPIEVSVTAGVHFWHAAPGQVQTFTVAPHSVRIVDLETLVGGAPVVMLAASRPCIVWSSMVDNVSGDASFVPFTQLYLRGDEEIRSAIPVVAHTHGSHGTEWVTDVYYDRAFDDHGSYEEDLYYYAPEAHFHPSSPSACGGVAAGAELTVPSLAAPPVAGDVVRAFAPCAADADVKGALEIHTGSWMSAWSRTYTTRADGGTYGSTLPLYPYRGWPVQHFAGIEVSPGTRVNLGLYNGDPDHAIAHRLTLYAADGTVAAERTLTLEPWASVQDGLEVMFGLPYGSIPAGTYGLTVLPLDDAAAGVEGRSWAYVSLVDNVTGDPTNWW